MLVKNTIAAERLPGAPGIGLKNVRERLAVQFEGRASLITSSDAAEWRSELSMPAVRESPLPARPTAPVERAHGEAAGLVRT